MHDYSENTTIVKIGKKKEVMKIKYTWGFSFAKAPKDCRNHCSNHNKERVSPTSQEC